LTIQITVDSHLRIPGLSTDWLEGLAKLVSVPNEEKRIALREEVYGAESMDDHLTLADLEEKELLLPRGFQHELTKLLEESGYDYELIDKREWSGWTKQNEPPEQLELKEDQREAVLALIGADQGRLILPPGKGKTVIGLFHIFRQGKPALIIVDKKHVAQQWVDRAKEHFDQDIGFIGDDRWEEDNSVTVALLQTLWSRRLELDANNWWDKWSTLILDEQHHIPADTFSEVLQRFPARQRYGISATVGKTEAKKRISELIFGPILYETDKAEVSPKVRLVGTGFDFDYHPTHRSDEGKVIRNNYQKLLTALTNDWHRNTVITDQIMNAPERAHLVTSNRLTHLRALQGLLAQHSDIDSYFLTGEESLDERMEVYELADKGACAIFSTLGVSGEALDIPRLDTLHLAWPIKNEEVLNQLVGRICRSHPDKDKAIVIDYVDSCEVLYRQYGNRLRNYYQPKKLKIEQQD
jgi:superfamily II DNA or RNA helicase